MGDEAVMMETPQQSTAHMARPIVWFAAATASSNRASCNPAAMALCKKGRLAMMAIAIMITRPMPVAPIAKWRDAVTVLLTREKPVTIKTLKMRTAALPLASSKLAGSVLANPPSANPYVAMPSWWAMKPVMTVIMKSIYAPTA